MRGVFDRKEFGLFSDVRAVALKTSNELYDADPDQKHNQKP